MLPDQLGALAGQTHQKWSLIISDDGSTDHWQDTVSKFANTTGPGQVWLMGGANKGHGRNYLSLALAAGPSVPFVAFSGQNTVWFAEKLARAVKHLKALPKGCPGLYCSRQVICDRDFGAQMFSENYAREVTFQNALVQNVGDLGTVVLNRSALDLVQDTVRHIRDQAAHDGWIFQLVTGAGGKVIFDEDPTQFHRKLHRRVKAGGNRTLRLQPVRACTKARMAALNRARHWLTPSARDTLDQLALAREARLPKRLRALRRSGVYGQTRFGTAALWKAALFKRL